MMSRKTILIVDDDAKLLLAMQKRMEHAGYEVVLATDGAGALEHARTMKIDVISLDVCMPGTISGLDVAAQLQRDPLAARIPIIFVTGSANDEFKQACTRVGAKYFLAKPFDADLLLQTVRGLFGEDELGEARRLSQAKRRQPVA